MYVTCLHQCLLLGMMSQQHLPALRIPNLESQLCVFRPKGLVVALQLQVPVEHLSRLGKERSRVLLTQNLGSKQHMPR